MTNEKETSAAGGGIKLKNTVTLRVNHDGYCVLEQTNTVCGADDFVGIFKNASLPREDSLDYEWCKKVDSFPYTSNVQAQPGLVAVYWSKDYGSGEYKRVCYTAGLPDGKTGVPPGSTTC